MKNIIMLFIALLLIISTTGCNLKKSNQNNQKIETGNNTSQKKESKIKQKELVKKIEAANLGYSFGEGMSSSGDVGVLATNKRSELGLSLRLGIKQEYMEKMNIDAIFFSFDNEDMSPQIERTGDIITKTIHVVTEEGAKWIKQEIEIIKNNPSEEYETSKDFGNLIIEFDYTVNQLFVTIDFK